MKEEYEEPLNINLEIDDKLKGLFDKDVLALINV